MDTQTRFPNASGAFKTIVVDNNPVANQATGTFYDRDVQFSASFSNAIYGNSFTVQPNSLNLNYMIKI